MIPQFIYDIYIFIRLILLCLIYFFYIAINYLYYYCLVVLKPNFPLFFMTQSKP